MIFKDFDHSCQDLFKSLNILSLEKKRDFLVKRWKHLPLLSHFIVQSKVYNVLVIVRYEKNKANIFESIFSKDI